MGVWGNTRNPKDRLLTKQKTAKQNKKITKGEKEMKKILCALLGMILTLPGFAACPSGQVEQTYTSATGTVTQNGTPSPDNPIEPVFYQQGDMILRKVGDVADSYDATTGKITRRVGVKVLDGTESVTAALSEQTPCFKVFKDFNVQSFSNPISCTHYQYESVFWAYADKHYKCSFGTGAAGNLPLWLSADGITTVDDFKAYLADQYANGTPVTVYYPLATETTETWIEESYCQSPIKIATTAYNSARFSPVVTELNDTIATIRSVVTNTINQTKAIADLQATKQTRPDENCPAGKKCLLVEDDAGQPHWYEIIENAYGLPSGYTGLEYLKSNTGTYIDTGYKANLNTKMVVDFAVGHEQPTGNTYIFGENSNGDNNKCFYMATKAGSLLYAQFDTISRQIVTDPSYVPNQKYRTTLSKDGWYVDNVLGATYNGATAFTTDNTLSLFKASRTAAQSGIIIYQATIYENDTLVRDFIPAKRNSDNVLGLYDLANDVFYTNAGTGTFVAGPEI